MSDENEQKNIFSNDLFDNDKFKQFMLIILRFEHGYKQ